MGTLESLAGGFAVVLTVENLLFVGLGVLLGTVVGLLPGLGPLTAMALLLPFTFELEPTSGVIMLAGIYYGSMYGGRIPAILLGLPGDASSVVTTFDGYPLTKQGRAGPALGITAIASFLGGTISIIGLTVLAAFIARYAHMVGSADMFMLAVLGLLLISVVGSGSSARSLGLAGLGLLVASVGLDPIGGVPRLTFGSLQMTGGLGIVPVVVGLFGLGEMLYNAERGFNAGASAPKIPRILPTMADWIASRMAILRAAVLGFLIGVLPGGGGVLSSVIAYGVEKRFSKHPEQFGEGAIDGLAATEAADNSSSTSAFIPLLTLGLPANPIIAIVFGALLVQNVTPGPNLINERPDIFWGVIASMYVGNLMLLVLNLPMIRVFVQLLKVPGGTLSPVIMLLALLGVYSVGNSVFDVFIAIGFGVVGYLFKRWGFSLGPFVLGFILGPIMEVQFRRAMLLYDGDLTIFVQRPISLTLLLLIVGGATYSLITRLRRAKSEYAHRD